MDALSGHTWHPSTSGLIYTDILHVRVHGYMDDYANLNQTSFILFLAFYMEAWCWNFFLRNFNHYVFEAFGYITRPKNVRLKPNQISSTEFINTYSQFLKCIDTFSASSYNTIISISQMFLCG